MKGGVQCLSNNALSGIPALRTIVCYLSKRGEFASILSKLCVWLHLRLYIICSPSINWFGCVLIYQGQLRLLCCVSSSTFITEDRRKVDVQITAECWKNLWFFSIKSVQFLTLLEVVYILFVFQKVLEVEGGRTAK